MGLEPAGGVDPEEAVALGAAIYAGVLQVSTLCFNYRLIMRNTNVFLSTPRGAQMVWS